MHLYQNVSIGRPNTEAGEIKGWFMNSLNNVSSHECGKTYDWATGNFSISNVGMIEFQQTSPVVRHLSGLGIMWIIVDLLYTDIRKSTPFSQKGTHRDHGFPRTTTLKQRFNLSPDTPLSLHYVLSLFLYIWRTKIGKILWNYSTYSNKTSLGEHCCSPVRRVWVPPCRGGRSAMPQGAFLVEVAW